MLFELQELAGMNTLIKKKKRKPDEKCCFWFVTVNLDAIHVLKCQRSAGGLGSTHLDRPIFRSAEMTHAHTQAHVRAPTQRSN